MNSIRRPESWQIAGAPGEAPVPLQNQEAGQDGAIARVTSHRFSTTALARPDQEEAWREWFRPIFEVISAGPASEGFAAVNQVWRLGELATSRVAGPASRVVRGRAHLRSNPVDHWILGYSERGSMTIRTGNGVARPPPGRPYLWSLAEPTEYVRTEAEMTGIFLPRDTFRDLAGVLDLAVGAVFDSPLGQILGDFILTLERHAPRLTAADLPRLTRAVGSLVAACIAPSPERLAESRGPIDVGRMERLRQTVRKHLRSPRLGPNTLGRLVGVSRSQLYRLLAETGGVARYIQRQRLVEAYRILSDPESTTPIFAIAEELCFEDASSFSRAFRREFEMSPSDVRRSAITGLPPLLPPQRQGMAEPRAFKDLLHVF